ncbi:hypothetical protein [Nonomuraea sp. SYSU D8015]|uniref:hypothetical protein n=1 Tax=Nonomuraea sp. SYSU D8015 TaxID=2593644 RepID=UPI0016605BDB|nr:hypothetical protein [Nonomuraea sp. SYSU D8015]
MIPLAGAALAAALPLTAHATTTESAWDFHYARGGEVVCPQPWLGSSYGPIGFCTNDADRDGDASAGLYSPFTQKYKSHTKSFRHAGKSVSVGYARTSKNGSITKNTGKYKCSRIMYSPAWGKFCYGIVYMYWKGKPWGAWGRYDFGDRVFYIFSMWYQTSKF